METKLTYLLQELKDNFTNELLFETIEVLNNTPDHELLEEPKKLGDLFRGQNEKFYVELAKNLVLDLDEAPEMLLMVWERLFEILDGNTLNTILTKGKEIATESDAVNLLNGLFEFYNDNIDIALFHFNEVESYVACYYIAFCYLYQDNFENSIKNNIFFAECLNEKIEEVAKIGMDLRTEYDVVLWNVYLDLGYAYTQTDEHLNAIKYFEKGFEILSIEDTFDVKGPTYDSVDLFQPIINCYLISLQKLGEYKRCLEILSFLITKYPDETYYFSLRKELDGKAKNMSFTNHIINQVFKTKQPVKIGKYEESKILAKERALEDMIIEQIKYGFKVFNRNLEIYENELIFGRQYYIQEVNGFLDLLLIDKLDNQLYVVELKRNNAGIEVIDQIEKYMKGLSNQLKQKVKGIICLHKPDNTLKEAVKNKKDIELYTYNFEFNEIK